MLVRRSAHIRAQRVWLPCDASSLGYIKELAASETSDSSPARRADLVEPLPTR
jgi:hypothetical protein